ncbi:MAG: thiamine diphosphokinase [Acidimicrobiales bacterium]|nr:thiamine diphosphokinase [Acidimicrobiales bacterium]
MAARGMETIVVVTGGDELDVDDLPTLPPSALVVAADSGIDRALGLGLRVDVAVGDFDSVSDGAMRAVVDAGAEVQRHRAAKDATDLELALEAALLRGPGRIVVLGGHGGRLDHLLANMLLLASDELSEVEVVAQMGPARVTVIRAVAQLHGRPGDTVTLLPVHGVASGVSTTSLLYPLADEDLAPGSTRGVSNEMTATPALVSVRAGTLLAVQPGRFGPYPSRT